MNRLPVFVIAGLLTVTGCGSNDDVSGSAASAAPSPAHTRTTTPKPKPPAVRQVSGSDNGVTVKVLDARSTPEAFVVDIDLTAAGKSDTLVNGGTYVGPDRRQYDDPAMYDTVTAGAVKTLTFAFPPGAKVGGTLRVHGQLVDVVHGDYDAYVNLPVRR